MRCGKLLSWPGSADGREGLGPGGVVTCDGARPATGLSRGQCGRVGATGSIGALRGAGGAALSCGGGGEVPTRLV